jgi:hypothetical protein
VPFACDGNCFSSRSVAAGQREVVVDVGTGAARPHGDDREDEQPYRDDDPSAADAQLR